MREGLLEAVPQGFDIRRGTVRAAMAALQKMPTPRTLIVDVSGEDQPLSALGELSDVVEPDVRVLVIGDRDDLNFYRQVTRGLGVLEYLYQPLMRDMVARHFGPLILHRERRRPRACSGGRVVTVTGVRGGTGASTIAANLAWHFGVEARRHTVLLDADLHRGTAAMLLGAKTGPGLRTALEAPDRIDELFVERAAQPVGKRLHVLAGEEKLSETVNYTQNAAARLLEALRRRYNFVVIDVPCSALPLHRDLLMMAHQRVLVMDPTLASVRDTLRLLALPNGPMQPRRGVLVLNRDNLPGGLNRRQLEEGLKMKPDVAIPDLPKVVGHAAQHGRAGRWRRAAASATASLQLAREVAFVRLLDSGAASARGRRPAQHGRLRRLARPEIMSVIDPRLSAAAAPNRSRPAPVLATDRAGRTGTVRPSAPDQPAPTTQLRMACLAQLDPAAVADMPPDRLTLEVERVLSEIATERRFQLNAREQRQLAERTGRRHARPRPAGAAARGRQHHRHHGERAEPRSSSSAAARWRCRTSVSATPRIWPTSASASPSAIGRRIDESSPMVDARLKDGSRVNIVFPPLALDGPYISIRKFSRKKHRFRQADRLDGALTPPVARVLEIAGAVPAERDHLRRHRLRQDHADERHVAADRPRRARRHRRGRRRAAIAAAARGAPGNPPGQPGGTRRGHPARPDAQRAAHAARPHHHRRGARRARRSTCCRR